MCIASWSMPACLNHLQNTGHKFPNMMLPMCKCVLHVYYLQQWLKSLPMVLSMMHTSMYHTPRAAIFSPNPISSHHCMSFSANPPGPTPDVSDPRMHYIGLVPHSTKLAGHPARKTCKIHQHSYACINSNPGPPIQMHQIVIGVIQGHVQLPQSPMQHIG